MLGRGPRRSRLDVFSVRRRCRPGGMGRHRRDRPSVAVRARIGPSSPRGRSSAGARTEELHESVERAVIGRTRGIRPSGANSARRAGYCGRNLSDAELMQYLSPVRLGPSSNTCPKWAPQLAHSTSVRRMNKLRSAFSSMLSFRTGAQKLGQPVPESYFVSEANRSRPQTTQMYTPGSWLFQYSPVKGRSVPLLMQTSYCNGERCCRSFDLSNFSTRRDVPRAS